MRVLVVGAGFAGVTAARELRARGHDVEVLEARGRIGGRTWLDHRLGADLEMGGTWVHWSQPFVWSEMAKYGIGTVASPEPQRAYWCDADEGVHQVGFDELIELMDDENVALLGNVRAAFPAPFDATSGLAELVRDDETVGDAIDRLGLGDDRAARLKAFWTLNFNGSVAAGALSQAQRWVAMTEGDWKVMWEACASLKLQGGTRRLVEAMAAGLRIRLDAAVERVEDRSDDIQVTLRGGEQLVADAVVVTAPLHVLRKIEFVPALPREIQQAGETGQVGLGTKLWIRVKGELPFFVALGSSRWPLTFFQAEYHVEGDTIVIGFGPDANAISADQHEEVQQWLRRFLPDVEVVDIAAHDWVNDPWAGETWPMHAPGFLTKVLPEIREGHGRVVFAGSDYSNGWGGFIDGAIQSGFEAANRVHGMEVAGS